jgi:phytoene/squalene synthetase
LPRESRRQFGYSDEDLQHRRTNAAFIELMQFEVARSRKYLLGGLPLVEALPGRLQIDIELFARGGLSILDQIEQIGYRVWQKRPVVSKRVFARLFVTAVGRSLWRQVRRQRATSAVQLGHDKLTGLTESAGSPRPSRTME